MFAKCRMPHKFGAVGDLSYLAKYGKNVKGESYCESCVSSFRCWSCELGQSGRVLYSLHINSKAFPVLPK
jgi:hypothetical protein